MKTRFYQSGPSLYLAHRTQPLRRLHQPKRTLFLRVPSRLWDHVVLPLCRRRLCAGLMLHPQDLLGDLVPRPQPGVMFHLAAQMQFLLVLVIMPLTLRRKH